MNDASKSWGRKSGESEEAFSAFVAYRDMGALRSLDRVGKALGKSGGLCERWSSRHRWAERCRAWDNHLQAERDQVAVAEARKWEKRRLAALEVNWGAAQQLREKAEKMLATPIHRQKTAKDGRTIIIEPMKWSFGTAAAILKVAAEIEAAVFVAVGQDVASMSDAELRATVEAAGMEAWTDSPATSLTSRRSSPD